MISWFYFFNILSSSFNFSFSSLIWALVSFKSAFSSFICLSKIIMALISPLNFLFYLFLFFTFDIASRVESGTWSSHGPKDSIGMCSSILSKFGEDSFSMAIGWAFLVEEGSPKSWSITSEGSLTEDRSLAYFSFLST